MIQKDSGEGEKKLKKIIQNHTISNIYTQNQARKFLVRSPATHCQHLSLQKSPVLHAAGGVHMKQLALDDWRVA